MYKKSHVFAGIIFLFIFVGAGCSIQKETENISPTPEAQKKEVTSLQIQEEVNISDTTEEIQKPVVQESVEAVPEIPKVTLPKVTMIDCGSNFDCFVKRAATCEKTKFLHVYTEEPEETPGIMSTFSTFYEITGMKDGQCQFYHGPMHIKVIATEAGKQLVMSVEGKTKEEVEQEIIDTNNVLDETAKAGSDLYCDTVDGKNISEHVQKLFKGEQQITSRNEKTTYGDNIFCIRR